MKHWKPQEIRARIDEMLPAWKCVARHNDRGHFYEVRETSLTEKGPIYPSVTGKLQILKDEGLINYKMNRAIEYVFANYKKFTDENVMEELDKASRVSQDILADAGDIGTVVHNCREDIFNEWIKTGVRPADFLKFLPEVECDVRAISAVRALQKFCEETGYIPVKCELLVFSHSMKTAGTLDDLGLMPKVYREGDPSCRHVGQSLFNNAESCILFDDKGFGRCLHCDYKMRYQFVLMDLKTSNQFKDHYFFQVSIYWKMLVKILGSAWAPERCFILKVSKEDGTYKIEDLKKHQKLAQYAEYMIRTNEGVEFIKSLRKDNQRKVGTL